VTAWAWDPPGLGDGLGRDTDGEATELLWVDGPGLLEPALWAFPLHRRAAERALAGLRGLARED
jgi:hypothetical protein